MTLLKYLSQSTKPSNSCDSLFAIKRSSSSVFFTFTNLQLDQKDTQSQTSGITDMYQRFGTYCKAFTTTMMHPSSVKVSMMNSNNPRIHHSIKWINTTPMILDERYKKQQL